MNSIRLILCAIEWLLVLRCWNEVCNRNAQQAKITTSMMILTFITNGSCANQNKKEGAEEYHSWSSAGGIQQDCFHYSSSGANPQKKQERRNFVLKAIATVFCFLRKKHRLWPFFFRSRSAVLRQIYKSERSKLYLVIRRYNNCYWNHI